MKAVLRQVGKWRLAIAAHLATHDFSLDGSQLITISQRLIFSLLSLKICEQRGVLPPGWLSRVDRGLWQEVRSLPLFPTDWLSDLELEDAFLRSLIHTVGLFTNQMLIPIELLGQIHEAGLGLELEVRGDRQVQIMRRPDPKKPSTKKSSGSYYTPAAIVSYIVQQTVGALCDREPNSPPTILDPACGGGIFLLNAYQFLLNQFPAADRQKLLLRCIYGVDLDPEAVQITRLSLQLQCLEESLSNLPDLSANIHCGNALIGSDFELNQGAGAGDRTRPFDWNCAFPTLMTRGFDVVIGNPPYLDSEAMTVCWADWRSYCGTHYRSATGNWDIFCVFIEKALHLCRSGGRVSFVVPNKLASADYAATVRSLLTKTHQLISIRDYSQVGVFAAAVYPIVFVAQTHLETRHLETRHPKTCSIHKPICYETMQTVDQVGRSQQLDRNRFDHPQRAWCLAGLAQQADLLNRLYQDFVPLGAIAQVLGAATVGEAYAIQPLMQEDGSGAVGNLPVVNSGTLDRYCLRWGQKRLRYLGNSFLYPVIPFAAANQLPIKRHQQALQPKIIVAGLTKRLECATDLTGAILAGKSTSIVLSTLDLRYLLGLLNSHLLSTYFMSSFSGNRLRGGYLRVGPPQLQQLPIPPLDLTHAADQQRYMQMLQLVDQMLDLQEQFCWAEAGTVETIRNENLRKAIAQIDHHIDDLVYDLYGLTNAEIKAIAPN